MGIISNGNTVIDNGAIEANEVDTTQLVNDAVDNTKLDLSDDYTFTGKISGQNYPAFSVNLGSNQTITSNVLTKVEFDTEDYDTDSDFDTTNNHFKVSVAGKYQFNVILSADNNTGADPDRGSIYIYKNDTLESIVADISRPASGRFMSINASFTLDLSVDDEIEVRVIVQPGTTSRLIGGTLQRNRFSGFRLGA